MEGYAREAGVRRNAMAKVYLQGEGLLNLVGRFG